MNKKLKEKMINAIINAAVDVRNLMIGLLFLFLTVSGVIYIYVFLRL
jgi:hypothetical protein